MSISYVDRCKQTISNTPGAGNLVILAAVSGYVKLDAVQNGLTFDVLIQDGTAWEISKDCLYTHSTTTLSRGTFVSSSTGIPLTLSSNTQFSIEQISQRLVPFTVSSPLPNQLLQFNGTNWVNVTLSAAVVDAIAVSFYGG